jgi:hypothetical protein
MAFWFNRAPGLTLSYSNSGNFEQNEPQNALDSANIELPFLDKLARAEKSASYAGWTLESLRKAYLSADIEVEEFEELVELVLLEAIHPQEKRGGVERPHDFKPTQDFQVFNGHSWDRAILNASGLPGTGWKWDSAIEPWEQIAYLERRELRDDTGRIVSRQMVPVKETITSGGDWLEEQKEAFKLSTIGNVEPDKKERVRNSIQTPVFDQIIEDMAKLPGWNENKLKQSIFNWCGREGYNYEQTIEIVKRAMIKYAHTFETCDVCGAKERHYHR